MRSALITIVFSLGLITIGSLLPAQFSLVRSTLFLIAMVLSLIAVLLAVRKTNNGKGSTNWMYLILCIVFFLIALSFLLSQIARFV